MQRGFDVKVVALDAGRRPRRRPERLRARSSRRRSPYVLHRTQVTARGRAGPRGGTPSGRGVPQQRPGLARPARGVALGERLLRHVAADPWWRHGAARLAALAAAHRRRRPARTAGARRCDRASGLAADARRRSPRSTSATRRTGACATTWSTGPPRAARSSSSSPSSTRSCRRRASTSRRRRSSCCASRARDLGRAPARRP